MGSLEITKIEEGYYVRVDKREGNYQNLDDVFKNYSFVEDLKEYVLEVFRLESTKKFIVVGCGDYWWAAIETEKGDLLEEEGSSPLKAAAALLLSIEARDE
jgi:hypothetical protein